MKKLIAILVIFQFAITSCTQDKSQSSTPKQIATVTAGSSRIPPKDVLLVHNLTISWTPFEVPLCQSMK